MTRTLDVSAKVDGDKCLITFILDGKPSSPLPLPLDAVPFLIIRVMEALDAAGVSLGKGIARAVENWEAGSDPQSRRVLFRLNHGQLFALKADQATAFVEGLQSAIAELTASHPIAH